MVFDVVAKVKGMAGLALVVAMDVEVVGVLEILLLEFSGDCSPDELGWRDE